MIYETQVGSVPAVCFDAFGTLIGFFGQRTHPYRHLADAAGMKQPQRVEFLTRNVGIEVFAEELGMSDLIPSLRRKLRTELASVGTFPEVATAFERLRAAGKRIGVCSNLAQPYGEAIARLLPGLDAYVLSYEVAAAKPHRAIYRRVCETLATDPGDVMFIGDSEQCDYLGPREFGMKATLLSRAVGQTLLDAIRDLA